MKTKLKLYISLDFLIIILSRSDTLSVRMWEFRSSVLHQSARVNVKNASDETRKASCSEQSRRLTSLFSDRLPSELGEL